MIKKTFENINFNLVKAIEKSDSRDLCAIVLPE